MGRLWPLSLAILMVACNSAPPQTVGPRMPDPAVMGLGPDPGPNGFGEPGPGFGTLGGGALGGGADLGRPLGGGNILGDMPAIETILSHGPVATTDKVEPEADVSADEAKAPDGADKATDAHRLLISGEVRCNPDEIRLKGNAVNGTAELTVVVPFQGKTKVHRAKSDKTLSWDNEGVASTRLGLAKLDDETAKPIGSAPIVLRSAETAPFSIAQVTIQAEDRPAWTIRDLNAVIPFDKMPNLAPGTKVTVTVSLKGDTSGALPFLLTSSANDGQIMHLWAANDEEADTAEAAHATFSRSFTLHQASRSLGAAKVTAGVGFIGVKIIDKNALLAGKGLRMAAMLLKFPSDKDGPATGYPKLKVSPGVKRQIQTILQTVDEAEAKRPALSAQDLAKSGR